RAPGSPLPRARPPAHPRGAPRPPGRAPPHPPGAAGLVAVRQGDTTTVLDYRRGAGLEILPRLLIRQGTLDPTVARSILEARLHNGPKVAELAAARAGDREALRHELDRCLDALARETEPVALQRHALAFWDHLVDAADSIVFRLMNNMLRAAYEPALEALAPLMTAEVGNVAGYRAIAEAVHAADPPAATAAARALLEPATTALIAALDAAAATSNTASATPNTEEPS
uniref:FadR/GntR family transcriptional regulator n=1 Tax=Nocardia farcinica TaxID=37329 RepID=UPI003CC7DD24